MACSGNVAHKETPAAGIHASWFLCPEHTATALATHELPSSHERYV